MFQKCIRSKTLGPTLVRYWLLETSNMRIFSDAMSKFARGAEWPNRLFASKMAPPTNK